VVYTPGVAFESGDHGINQFIVLHTIPISGNARTLTIP
jgi:hypothetical protein